MFCEMRGCVFPMVIWPAFRMGQYRVSDHLYHAPQFIKRIFEVKYGEHARYDPYHMGHIMRFISYEPYDIV